MTLSDDSHADPAIETNHALEQATGAIVETEHGDRYTALVLDHSGRQASPELE
jgi:hypothetical protein